MSQAPRKRKQAEQRSTNPLSEVFSKNEEYKLPLNQIISALYHYSTELDIRTASSLKLNYALGAGIQLERKQYSLNSKKAEAFSLRGKAIANGLWKYLWSLRFAAVVIDEQAAKNDDPIPYIVLKIEQLEVKYFRDPLGRKWCRYFIPGGSSDVISKEIPNVLTFFLDDDFLDEYGNICSLVTSIIPELQDLQSKRVNTWIADWARANPLLVTEKPMPKNDPENISALPELYEPLGTVNKDKSQTTTVSTSEINSSSGDMFKSRITPSEMDAITNGGNGKNKKTITTDQYQTVLDLAEGRTLANPPIPEAPTDLLTVAAQKKENVFMAFGIPLSMISNASSSSTMKAASGNAGGKKAEGQNSSAKEMFYANLADMKDFTIGMLEKMINDYYLREHVEQVKADNKKEGKEELSLKQLGEEAYTRISIPGRADMDMIIQFYQMGAIKFSYFKKHASFVYFIPEDAWNSENELSILEINGMQPPEPKPKSSSSSK